MSRNVVTISHLPGRRVLAGSFSALGAGVPVPQPNPTISHALSYTLVDDGAGTIGYRVKIASGEIKYDMEDDATSILSSIKLDDATGHAVSAMRVNDTASSLGLPKKSEFDLVIRTLAGAIVQTNGIGVSWTLVLKDRG